MVAAHGTLGENECMSAQPILVTGRGFDSRIRGDFSKDL